MSDLLPTPKGPGRNGTYDWSSDVSPGQVTVVVPCINEEDGIISVIDAIKKSGFENILVIDGGSTDETVIRARSRSVQVVLQHGRGKSAAIDTSIQYVKTPYFALIDGDATYNPEDLRKMLAYFPSADMVIGSRVLLPPKGAPFAAGHQFANRLLNWTFNRIYDAHLTDILSGIRMIKTEALGALRVRSSGFTIEAELGVYLLTEGRKVIEIPASFRTRVGKAKLRYRDGFHILALILKLAYEFNPLLFFIPVGVAIFLPGVAILIYVLLLATNAFGVFHSGWALAGVGFVLSGIQFIGFGILSLLMKRIEHRQLRAIHEIARKA